MSEEPVVSAEVTSEELDDVPARANLPSLRVAVLWAAFALVAVLLDGPYGGVVPVIVAAVLLARVRIRVIAAIGVAALALVPFTVVLRGLPAPEDVSPRFVLDSMAAHHLTFGGLLLVATWAVLDMWPAMRATARSAREVPPPPVDAPPRPDLFVAIIVVACVAVLAVLACLAVLAG